MKYSTEAKSMLEGYLEQAQITVKKEDKEFLADMISKEYEGSKLTNAECDKIVKTLETYAIDEIWTELKDQILKDLSGYVDDMSNPENFSNKKNFGKVKDLLITVSDILKKVDFFAEDEKLYEDIESGKLFEDLDTKDVDMSNPKEIAKFIVKNVPDPKETATHSDDEEYFKAIDDLKINFANKKNFGDSIENVSADKFYVITDGSAEKFAGIESGEELLRMFKRSKKLIGNDKFILNKDGYDSWEDAVNAVKESEYKFKDDEEDFSNKKNFSYYDDDRYDDEAKASKFLKDHPGLKKILDENIPDEPDPSKYKEIAEKMNKYLNGGPDGDLHIEDYDVEEFVKVYFCNSKNFAFDAKAGAKRLESITGIKNWEYAGDKFVTPDGLYTLGNEAEEGNEPVEYIYTSNGSEVKVLGEIKDNKYEIYKDPIKLGDKQNFSNKNFGNPVSGKLPTKIDSFLQDLAQMYGKFDYGDIMEFEPDEAKIKELNKLYKQCTEAAEVDDEHEMEEIARTVADILKSKSSKNFANVKLPVRARKNFSKKNFNDEKYPDEKEPTTKVNFDGTKLPVRARFTMQNPRY